MKKVIVCLMLSISILTSSGQIAYFGLGKTISKFQYKNSEGKSLKGLKGVNQGSFNLGVRYSLFYTPWHVSCDAMYNRYGAKGSDPVLGNYYEWDATYIGANLGIDYEFLKPPVNYNEQHGFSFYIKLSAAAEFLLDGTQNLNNQLTDLNGEEEFDKPLYFVRGGIGLNYYLSKTYIIYAQYMGGRSFLIGDYKNKEQLNVVTHNVSFGLSINLFYRK